MMLVLVLLVASTVGLLIADVALTSDGGSAGFLLGGEDDGSLEAVSLGVEVDDRHPETGQRVAVTVTRVDTGEPVENAQVLINGTVYETPRNGTVHVSVGRAGEYDLRIRKRNTADPVLTATRTNLTVTRRTEGLTVRTNRTTVRTDRPVAVEVVRSGSDERVDALLRTDGRARGPTDNGSAVLRFREAGTVAVFARKSPTPGVRFVSGATTVTVHRRVVDLSVTLNDSAAVAGDPVEATVTRADTGTPVPATLHVQGETHRTGPDGTAVIRPDRAGMYSIHAEANRTPRVRFRDDRAWVTVERRPVPLALTTDDAEIEAGERVELTLRRADSLSSTTGTVEFAGTNYSTDENGRVRLTLQVPGTYTARGVSEPTDSERFVPDETTVFVRGPWFDLGGFAGPSAVRAGENVTVTATITNAGNREDDVTIAYRFDGETLGTRELTLRPGEGRSVEFDVRIPDRPPGNYTHSVAVVDSDTVAVRDERVLATVEVTAGENEADD